MLTQITLEVFDFVMYSFFMPLEVTGSKCGEWAFFTFKSPIPSMMLKFMSVQIYSRMSETENATGAASRGRKLQSARVGTLKSSIVQYWDK